MRAAAQVLTCAEEFASVRSGLQALGIPIAEDRSGLIFAPLSTIEVPLNSLHALFKTLGNSVNLTGVEDLVRICALRCYCYVRGLCVVNPCIITFNQPTRCCSFM